MSAKSSNWPAVIALTISPELMKELTESTEPLERKLDPEKAKSAKSGQAGAGRKEIPLAAERQRDGVRKTGEGIRKFAADIVKLEKFVASKL